MVVKIWRSSVLNQFEFHHGTDVIVSTPRHFHEDFQIGFVEGGALDVLLPNIHQVASINELFIIPPGEVHTARSLGEVGWSYHMMYFEPNLLQQAFVETTERNKPLSLRPFAIAEQQIRIPFQQLYQSIRESGTVLEQQSHLLVAFAQLIVHCSEDPPPRGKEALNLCLREYFCTSMTLNLHLPTGNTSLT